MSMVVCQCRLSTGPRRGQRCQNQAKYPSGAPMFCGTHKECRSLYTPISAPIPVPVPVSIPIPQSITERRLLKEAEQRKHQEVERLEFYASEKRKRQETEQRKRQAEEQRLLQVAQQRFKQEVEQYQHFEKVKRQRQDKERLLRQETEKRQRQEMEKRQRQRQEVEKHQRQEMEKRRSRVAQILVIEDNEYVLYSLKVSLERTYRCEVTVARTMEMAGEYLAEKNRVFDLIITDTVLMAQGLPKGVTDRKDITNVMLYNAQTPIIITDNPVPINKDHVYWGTRNMYAREAERLVEADITEHCRSNVEGVSRSKEQCVDYVEKVMLINEIVTSYGLLVPK